MAKILTTHLMMTLFFALRNGYHLSDHEIEQGEEILETLQKLLKERKNEKTNS